MRLPVLRQIEVSGRKENKHRQQKDDTEKDKQKKATTPKALPLPAHNSVASVASVIFLAAAGAASANRGLFPPLLLQGRPCAPWTCTICMGINTRRPWIPSTWSTSACKSAKRIIN